MRYCILWVDEPLDYLIVLFAFPFRSAFISYKYP
jgi:hypothetical protein